MDRFDRIYQLDAILKNARYPVSKSKLQDSLECSSSTIDRAIEDLRDHLNAPLTYDRKQNGYFYKSTEHGKYELPGLWFNAAELFALLASQKLLQDVQPGLLEEPLKPLIGRIKNLLSGSQLGHENLLQRIRLIRQASRTIDKPLFQQIITAIATRKKIQCTYHARGTGEITSRTLSPQRLVHYRDNWYLDAWCHKRESLRTFSMDKFLSCRKQNSDALDFDEAVLDDYFASSYGIFSGQADKIAVLKFTEKYALWVADESWHPEQKGEWLENGSYRLEIPYRHSQELMMDILKYGAEVEVIEPLVLREQHIQTIKNMTKVYQK